MGFGAPDILEKGTAPYAGLSMQLYHAGGPLAPSRPFTVELCERRKPFPFLQWRLLALGVDESVWVSGVFCHLVSFPWGCACLVHASDWGRG